MDYNSINNCMSGQQKLSLAASALNQMVGQEPKTYDEINDTMSDQQKLSIIASALQTLKDQGGGSGTIEPLNDYLDPATLVVSDLNGLISAIEDGKGFYLDLGDAGGGIIPDGIYSGSVTDTEIILSSSPLILNLGSAAQPRYVLEQLNFHFDKTTGVLDPTAANTMVAYPFANSAATPGRTMLGLGTLTINVGSDVYTYDGSSDVTISI